MALELKTFEVESLFLRTFVLALVRRMTVAAAAATAVVTIQKDRVAVICTGKALL